MTKHSEGGKWDPAFRLARWLWLVLPVFMLWAGQSYTVNVPKWDDWPIVGEPLAAHVEGRLSPGDFLDQVVDNRMPVSRVVFFALALASDWNARANTLATWVFAMGGLGALYILGKRTWPDSPGRRHGFLVVAGILVFTPTGWMLWTFCPFMANTLMLALVLWCVVALAPVRPASTGSLAVGIVLALAASWIYLAGWLAWAVVLWMVLGSATDAKGNRARILWVWAICLLLAGVMAVFYFRGYVFEGKPGLGDRLLTNPLSIPLFFTRWLGAPFGDLASLAGDDLRVGVDRVASAVIGSFGLCALVWTGAVVARNPALRAKAWPWFAIAGWGLASGALVTLGRIELNENAAFWPRYQLFAVMVWISLFALMLLLPMETRRGRITAGCSTFLLGGGLVAGSVGAMEDMRGDFLASLNVRAGLQMMEAAPTALPLHRIYPANLDTVRRLVAILEPAGFLKPGLLKSRKVADAHVVAPSGRYEGEILAAQVGEDGSFSANGWAFDREKRRPVDAIVLSVTPPDGDETWFALAGKFSDGKKLAAARNLHGRFARIRWAYMELPPGLPHVHAKVVPLPALPAKGSVVRAYVLDTEALAFTRLGGEILLP